MQPRTCFKINVIMQGTSKFIQFEKPRLTKPASFLKPWGTDLVQSLLGHGFNREKITITGCQSLFKHSKQNIGTNAEQEITGSAG